jgi:hypothetical protein
MNLSTARKMESSSLIECQAKLERQASLQIFDTLRQRFAKSLSLAGRNWRIRPVRSPLQKKTNVNTRKDDKEGKTGKNLINMCISSWMAKH